MTGALDPGADSWLPSSGERGEDDALVGTLVHRLFQFAAETPADEVVDLAARLMRPEERVTAADASAYITRAIEAWTAMRAQPGVTDLLESGARIHELPFSCVAQNQPGRVLRGTIDCLVRRDDGSIVVIEFKTGARSPSHQIQLDLYLQATRALFPEAAVTGRILYPR